MKKCARLPGFTIKTLRLYNLRYQFSQSRYQISRIYTYIYTYITILNTLILRAIALRLRDFDPLGDELYAPS